MIRRVFISHGHDILTTNKVKDFIRNRLKLDPVVLSEQPDLGLTIVEKLEHYGKDCEFAIIIFTADDETMSGGFRARQNVIHELGYFHSLIGRNRVLLLKEAGIELFSNISGLIYKEFPHGSVESVFKDIRFAIESGDASKHALSIPHKEKSEERSIEGIWHSSYSKSDGNHIHNHMIKLQQSGNDVSGHSLESSSSPHSFIINGVVRFGVYFIGTWESRFKESVHHGVFQFTIDRKGQEMVGKWLGTSGVNPVNVGDWILKKT